VDLRLEVPAILALETSKPLSLLASQAMIFFAATGSARASMPKTEIAPLSGRSNPVTMRSVVVLPAPLGPRKPSTSPRSTVNETPSTARLAPNVFTRFSILIMD